MIQKKIMIKYQILAQIKYKKHFKIFKTKYNLDKE